MASELQHLLMDASAAAVRLTCYGRQQDAALIDRLRDTLVNTALALASAEGRIKGMEWRYEIERKEADRD